MSNHLATSGQVTLDSAGGVGSSDSRLMFDGSATPSSVIVGATSSVGGGVFMGGLGGLTLGDIQTANAPLDVIAEADLAVAPGAMISTGTGTIALAAGVFNSGLGTLGGGVLAIGSGATVVSEQHRRQRHHLPRHRHRHRHGRQPRRGRRPSQQRTQPNPHVHLLRTESAQCAGSRPRRHPLRWQQLQLGRQSHGERVAPGSTTSDHLTGLNDPAALAVDAAGNLYVANSGSNTT